MSITHDEYLNLVPGSSSAPVIKVSQYDADFIIRFHLVAVKRGIIPHYPIQVTNDSDVIVNIATSSSVSVRGTKTDGNGYSANATLSGTATAPIVTVAGHEQMTASAGVNVYEITFYAADATKRLSTANFILFVEPAALDASTITSESLMLELNDLIAAVPNAVAAADRAEAAVQSVEGVTTQVATNTQDISDIKADLNRVDRVVQDELEPVLSDVSQVKSDVSQIKTILPKKVNQPLNSSSQPVYGTNGQVLRTKGDGSTEWATVGQPTDAQTAQAVSDWLDAHPEATTSVEDGSISEQKLTADVIARLNNMVSVRNYGAVGNDFVDDTAAIQRCIDENPRSTIFFPQGVYRISETIHCRGRKYGGTYLFMGGAVIKANADMEAMFYFDDNYSGNIDTAVEGGPFGIFGGRLDGNKHADICIKNDSWFIEVNNTYMLSFLVAGVYDEGGGLSSYHRIKCDLARTDEAWSEGTTAGIIAGCVDSFFTDVQIQNCHYGVRLRGGGNSFNGCYFFSRVNTTLNPDAEMQGYGVYIERDSNSAALATFNNCYFDSNIYAIYSAGSKVWNVTLNSCFCYITHDSYFTATKVYLLGGSKNVNLRARGLECHSSPTCDMLLGRQAYSIENNRNMLIEQNKPNTNINNLFNIVNLDSAFYVLKAADFQNGTIVLIGGIAIGNSVYRTGVYKLSVSFGQNKAEAVFSIDSASNFTFQSLESSFLEDRFSIIIDTTYKTDDAMTNLQYYPIYLKSNISGLNGFLHIELAPLSFNPASCYLFNDTYRKGTFETTTPFEIKTYKSQEVVEDISNFYISNFQTGDTVKLGSIDSIMPNQCLQIEVGNGGSYAEFVIRKVANTMTLWDAKRYFNTNFFFIVIDQTPQVTDGVSKYSVYLSANVNDLNGNIRIKIKALTPGSYGNLLKAGYETGEFTISNPLSLAMKETT